MNYRIPNNLLSKENAKTIKGEKLGYTTYIMYLAPHTQNSKGENLCTHASPGCIAACLFGSGAARFDAVQEGKINKTEFFVNNKSAFMLQLVKELTHIVKMHKRVVGEKQMGANKVIRYKKFAVRLNGTSDKPWELFRVFRIVGGVITYIEKEDRDRTELNIFELFPDVQFYDYTKVDARFDKVLPNNYHLTFSRSETNDVVSENLLDRGFNVAYVFGVKDVQDLPKNYRGFKVINGDESDLRFLDEENVIVGLKYKLLTGRGTAGKNKEMVENNDFLIDVTELELV